MSYYWIKSKGKMEEIKQHKFQKLRLENVRFDAGHILIVETGATLWINQNSSTIELRKEHLRELLNY